MTESQYNRALGKILAGAPLDTEEGQQFTQLLTQFEELLDEGDQDDFFGTEGWRHRMGWD